MPQYTISLHKNCSLKRCGGKTYQLSRLLRHRFAIPLGFCITTDAFSEFCSANRLKEMVRNAFRELKSGHAPFRLLEEVRNGIEVGVFPNKISAEISNDMSKLKATRLAVRSSAIAEDGFQHSFAGLLETRLNVSNSQEDILNAVKMVWSSLFSERVFRYLLQQQSQEYMFSIGVLVQEMVPAQKSGVAFSIHPATNDPELVYIEETQAGGEALVGGDVTPVIHSLYKEAAKNSLSPDSYLSQLFPRILQLEDSLHYPVDVEWAYDGKCVWILQVRPVTGLRYDDINIWTDENVGEVLPSIVTPLSWSVLDSMTNNSFRWIFKKLGIGMPLRVKIFKKIHGKVYFNHSLFSRTVDSLFPSDYRKQRRLKNNLINTIRSLGHSLHIMVRLFVLSIWLPFCSKRMIYRFSIDNSGSAEDPVDVGREIENIIHMETRLMRLHVANTFIGEIFFQILHGVLSKFKPYGEGVSAEKAVSDIGETTSARSGIALQNLANRMRESMNRNNLIAPDAASFVELVKTNKILLGFYADFLEKYGFMSDQEFELSYPRWVEESDKLLWVIFKLIHRGQQEQSEFVSENLMVDVSNTEIRFHQSYLMHWFVYRLVRWVKKFNRNRENLKQLFIRTHFQLKKKLLQVADRLEKNRIIVNGGDIYFLKIGEILSLQRALLREKPEYWRSVVKKRHKFFEGCKKMPHPYRLIEYDGEIRSENLQQVLKNGALGGISCSTGQSEGPARVLRTFEESNDLKPGEILVTHAANPGWTPLFLLAKGIITEIGGALSHSAIIAREYGIPMVASVTDAISKIETGDHVLVDGTNGIVQISKSNR